MNSIRANNTRIVNLFPHMFFVILSAAKRLVCVGAIRITAAQYLLPSPTPSPLNFLYTITQFSANSTPAPSKLILKTCMLSNLTFYYISRS